MAAEDGPYYKRSACRLFVDWVSFTGRRVRGTHRGDNLQQVEAAKTMQADARRRLARQRLGRLKSAVVVTAKLTLLDRLGECLQGNGMQGNGMQGNGMQGNGMQGNAAPDTSSGITPEPAAPSPLQGIRQGADPAHARDASGDPSGDPSRPLEPDPPPPDADVWPLQVIDVGDDEQMEVLYDLLARLPQAVLYYLHTYILPTTMEFRELKISASGQDLGGDILFPLRLGFSGTPSNLLPEELGSCQYAEGDEAKILTTLTDPKVISLSVLPSDWAVDSALELIAQGGYSALIDTGALITGYTNQVIAAGG